MALFRDPLTKALADIAESIMEGKVMCEACGKMHAEGACSMNEKDIELPEEITDEDAGDFVVAASAAKKAGKKKFKFGGKEYPVTIKTDIKTEEVELDEAVVIDYDDGLDADDPDLKKLLKQLRAKIKVTGTDPNGFDEVKFTFPNDAAVKKFIKTTGIDILGENLDEAVKITHVVIDTADDDKVVSMASDEKGAKSSIVSAERPPMSIKDKKTLKVVKLKKPAGQKAADRLIGYPLKEEALDEEKVECPKCRGEGCDHCDGKGYHEKVEEAKSDYEIKHKTFSSAIQHAVEVAAKKGYEVDPDDYDRKVAMGPKKPSKGKTNSYSIKLTKNGKEQRKALQVQIANLDDKFYELNMYIQ